MNKTLNFKTLKTFLQLLLLVVSVFGFSQTPVTYVANPSNAEINSALQGNNVVISGGTLNFGSRADQIATFTGGVAAGLNMENGVYFGTGTLASDLSTNTVTNSSNSVGLGNFSDPDLITIDNTATRNVVSYSFTVTMGSKATVLYIAYQFGSEEYPDYVGSNFDDAFGFFVTGPGITGTTNIAKLPNGSPISINKVNYGVPGFSSPATPVAAYDGTQSALYTNNGHPVTVVGGKLVQNNGTGAKPIAVQFNGMTKQIIYSVGGLTPGGTYTFKIAIADAGDNSMDSGVFINDIYATATLAANNDTYTIVSGSTSTTSVLNNDSVNGAAPASFTDVFLSQVSTTNTGVNLDPLTGKINVAAGTPAGTYTVTYQICDQTFTSNCKTATATLTVLVDKDNDGIADVNDLDDDNDGILDTNECSASTNIAINNLTVITAGSYTPDANNLVVGDRLFKDNIVLNGTTYDAVVTIKSLYNPTPVGRPTPSRLVLNTGNLSLNGYAAQNPYVIYTVRIVQDNSISSATPDGTGINLNGITLTFSDIDGATPRDQTDVFGINNASTPEYMNIGSALSYNGFLSGGPGASYGRFIRTPNTVAPGVPAADVNYWVDAYYGSYDSSITTNNEFVFGMTGNENTAISSRLFFNNINIECDTDNDGTPNRIDLDSDNDGCADAIEGSENVKYNQIHDLNLPLADPNYAYRGQIKVTYNGTTTSTPSGIISNSPSANGVPQLLNNAGNNLNASTNPSNLAGAVDNTDGTADIGQGIGDSQDNTINSCKCYKAPSTDGNNYPTNHGITAFNRAGADNQNWPMVRQSGWTALEASTKGFVINRMPASTTGGNAGEPVNGTGTPVITSPIAGMMFYDTTNDCLKINVDGTRSGWKCFNNQSCPDEN